MVADPFPEAMPCLSRLAAGWGCVRFFPIAATDFQTVTGANGGHQDLRYQIYGFRLPVVRQALG